jgi:uncharacterized protein (DUF2237 family)
VPARDTGPVTDRNVLGGELVPCGTDPVTGFYRDGWFSSGFEDMVSVSLFAVVSSVFLVEVRRLGIVLISTVAI